MNFVFLSWDAIKDEAKMSGAYNHNERQKEAYLSNPNIRKEYTNQNYHFKRPEAPYTESVQTLIGKLHIKVTRSTNLLIDGVISPSPEWIAEKSREQQMEFFFRAYEYIASRFTERNILSTVVHMDEDTPHMHFDVVPITPENHMSASYFFPYPDGKVVEQNMFYEYMHSYYPDISRGVPDFMLERDHLAMKYFKAVPEYFEMSETMWKAIESIEGKGKELQERKDWAETLYAAVSKMAAYTIVMQEGEVNYYRKKLVPHLLEEIQKKDRRIEELSKTKKGSPNPKKKPNVKKNKDKKTEPGVEQKMKEETSIQKHLPTPSERV